MCSSTPCTEFSVIFHTVIAVIFLAVIFHTVIAVVSYLFWKPVCRDQMWFPWQHQKWIVSYLFWQPVCRDRMWFPLQHQKWIVSFGHWNVCIKLDRFKFWLSRCELLQFLWQKLARKKVGWIYSQFNRFLQKLGKTVSIVTPYTFLFSVLNLQWSPLMKMRFDHIAHNSNLYYNQLSGGIPSTLGQLQHLKYLYVKAWIPCSLYINDGMHRLFLFLNNGKMALCKTSGTFQAIRWPVLYLQAWQSCRIWNHCMSVMDASNLVWGCTFAPFWIAWTLSFHHKYIQIRIS